jgi:hypothetical protein
MMNLSLPADELKNRLRREWKANDYLDSLPSDEVARLTADKYSKNEWVERR